MDTHKSGKTFPFLRRICRIGISLFNFNRSTELCDLPTSTKFQQGRLNASDKDCNFDNSLTTCFVTLPCLQERCLRIFIIYKILKSYSRYYLKSYHRTKNINFLKNVIFYFTYWSIDSNILNITPHSYLFSNILQNNKSKIQIYSTKNFTRVRKYHPN